MTADEFYNLMLFDVLPVRVGLDTTDLMRLAAQGNDEIVWLPYSGHKVGKRLYNGWFEVYLDLGDRIIGARRTQTKSTMWIGKPPRQTDLVMMKLMF